MPYRLLSIDGDHVFELRTGTPLVLGRSLSSDLPLLDPTISRRHAELSADDDGVEVRDLGSSNGTLVNGVRVDRARITPGDRVAFGRVTFALHVDGTPSDGTAQRASDGARGGARDGPRIVGRRAVPTQSETFAEALRKSGTFAAIVDELDLATPGRATTPIAPPSELATQIPPSKAERDRTRLELLLELSKALTGTLDVDGLLERVAEYVFRLVDVDRLSILLVDESGDLVPRLARDRSGHEIARAVPLSIARTVIADKVAILSANAPQDARFRGESIVRDQVRSAICVPLLGREARVLGVFYVDTLSAERLCTESDLDFLVAFSGIVAVALGNAQMSAQIRREAVVRSNFERFFAPGLAERIASASDVIQLGGERRTVAVLFCDIRGFTELAAAMRPDETARLLTDFFTEMVECVFRHGGTLDKFMGDAVMAQWGAPIGEVDDADRALDAADDMRRSLERLNARWRAEGRAELQIGIGVNYGEAFAGTIGSERRLEFTVIGDTVNTASRLCAWADGGEVLVSEALRLALTRAHPLAPREALALRGKRDPVTVWRLVP